MLNNKYYTVGELAKATGLTVRTLQHYDNIGLLPPSGRTEGGRRFYTEGDIVTLMQIVFYKSVGIQLTDIRDKLMRAATAESVKQVLDRQLVLIVKRIDSLNMTMAVINAAIDTAKNGQFPPYDILAKLIRSMEGSSMVDWTGFEFDASFTQSLENSGFTSLDGAMAFYRTMRELMVKAISLRENGVKPESEEGQIFAKQWWEVVIVPMIGDNPEAFNSLVNVNQARESWPTADRKLFENAEPFIESALAIYCEKSGIKPRKPEKE